MAPNRDRTVRTVLTTFRHYLETWQHEGPRAAGARYLFGDERPSGSGSDKGFPRLDSASLIAHELVRWRGASRLTVMVTMRMQFAGDPVAWDEGVNTRFVTADRTGRPGRYRLYLATSP
jgi:hypothetical protein